MRQKTFTPVVVTAFFLAGCSESVSSPRGKPAASAVVSPAPAPLRITQFYASPPRPHRGEKTLLCYGVENAAEVRLDPPVEKVWPSVSRCFEVSSEKAATYTLIASGAGASVSQTVSVRPGPPAVKLLEVSISSAQVPPGGLITVCFKARNAKNVSIRPGVWVNPHDEQVGCTADHPRRDTTYTVTATGAGGDTEVQRVTARVQ
jgi:hypothetical protein